MFMDIDEWMLSIELKKVPSARERRQHMKLERIRDKSYEKYLERFEKSHGPHDVPIMKYCSDRFRTPLERLAINLFDSYKKALGCELSNKVE